MNDQIEKYLNNRLSAAEKEEFEIRMGLDDELNQEVQFQRDLKIAVTLNERQRLKSLLSKRPQSESFFNSSLLKWAASFIFFSLIAATVYWYLNVFQQENRLFLAYYEPFPNLELPSVRGSGSSNGLINAYVAFDNGEYREAKEMLMEDHELNGNAVSGFYAAMAAIELREYDEAIYLLEKVEPDLSDIYLIPSKWYRSLLEIQSGNKEKAKEMLEQVKGSNHSLAVNAEKILKKIK